MSSSAPSELNRLINGLRVKRSALKLKQYKVAGSKQNDSKLKDSLLKEVSALEKRLRDELKSIAEESKKNLSFVDKTMMGNLESISTSIGQIRDEVQSLKDKPEPAPTDVSYLENAIAEIARRLDGVEQPPSYDPTGLESELQDLKDELKKLRNRVNTPHGGGNANRNILVAGNPSTLGRYTDLNLKPGTNIQLTYVNNDNLKTTDLTITGTGGGSGITRSVSTVSTSQTLGSAATTDYVYVAGAGVQLTMPDATTNSNLYTIKNKSTSSVLIGTTAGQKIDGQSTLILVTQFTSVDLSSDTANWNIT